MNNNNINNNLESQPLDEHRRVRDEAHDAHLNLHIHQKIAHFMNVKKSILIVHACAINKSIHYLSLLHLRHSLSLSDTLQLNDYFILEKNRAKFTCSPPTFRTTAYAPSAAKLNI